MKRIPRRFAVPAALLTAAATLTACGGSDTSTQPGANAPNSSSSGMGTMGTSPSTTANPSATGTPAAGEQNAADATFAMMMIPHHAQAVKMSETILAKNGIPQQISDLATQIKAAQGPEIEQMRGWLAGWGQPVPAADGSMAGMGDSMSSGGMDGMMGEADMAKLQAAQGAEATRLFLIGMIGHHTGAIDMATTELAQGTNPDAKNLAQDIITAQKAEITQMNQLLKQ